ncbi:MAG: SDR family oxidoreductase [Anaerolineaceae bacterium]|nr:SDR family oxidoreductase [Anaerolineaceae bacterium]MDD4043204.1 SDR family oxidoreductase [Anaerolineaceae bacterium]MDD4577857.1 SDR family oxidoreductase [Anaerolineaceae bacterium]
MKVLFIGGKGTISYSCSNLAIKKGYQVSLLNRGKSTLRERLPVAELILADIRDPESVRQALGNRYFDVVVEFLAFNPEHIEVDLKLFRGRTNQYIFISSASAYQTPPENLPVTEETPLENPIWQYSRDKIACEARLMQAYHEEGFPVTIVRPSHTYDEGYIPVTGRWTFVERLLQGKPVITYGDGTSIWTLTHSSDFAKGFVGLFGKEEAIGQAYHITSDEWQTWNQIVGRLADAVGVEPKIVHVPSDLIAQFDPEWGRGLLGDKANSFILDNSKIKALVPEFVCTVPFREGIARTVEYHRRHDELRVINTTFNDTVEAILDSYAKAWPAGAWWR